MIIKSFTMLIAFFAPLIIITLGIVANPLLVYLLYILSGMGMAGIGMGIMHDAIHGTYSKKKWLNNLMANTIGLIGASKDMWRLQHNVLHHTFTNIENHDEDINAPLFLRFSPNSKKNRIHKYQHLYAWIFYGLSTIYWATTKDFLGLKKYREMGLIMDEKQYKRYFINIIIWKIFFFSVVLVLPMIFSAVSPWIILSAFLVMQFITGFSISIVFQTAHVMPNAEFPLPNAEGNMDNDRMKHQLVTTCNFSQKSNFLFWLLGGLTNQIEHHLFPNISHIHYKKIAPIVKQTAEEFGLPYHTNGSFVAAVIKHFKMLKELGTMEVSHS